MVVESETIKRVCGLPDADGSPETVVVERFKAPAPEPLDVRLVAVNPPESATLPLATVRGLVAIEVDVFITGIDAAVALPEIVPVPTAIVQVDPRVQVIPLTVVEGLASDATGTSSYVTVFEAVTTGTVPVVGVAG